jgi:type IV secretory pathway TraG/TraD family ATPase VirD4
MAAYLKKPFTYNPVIARKPLIRVIYGRARAQVLRDNMDSQIYCRPADLQTAEYLENRLGYRSAWAHSKTRHDGHEVSEGEQERFIPLLSKQEIMQLPDEAVIGFTGNLPPFQGLRIDWRRIPDFQARQKIAPPPLPVLPKLEETLEAVSTNTCGCDACS